MWSAARVVGRGVDEGDVTAGAVTYFSHKTHKNT